MNHKSTNTTCPHCKKCILMGITFGGQDVTGYYCTECASQFSIRSHYNPVTRIITTVALRYNPDYQIALDSEDWIKNIEKELELKKQGVPQYTNGYVIRVDNAT